MELVKREDHWALYNEDGHKIAATIPGCNSKLSIKNCEAIENGYDLDELAKQNWRIGLEEYIPTPATHVTSFKAGFQKAVEILGNKKFSEKDMKLAIEYGIQSALQAVPGITSTQSVLDSYKQSLQQTEFDVEIEWEKDTELFNVCLKLDDNGCLILKRI